MADAQDTRRGSDREPAIFAELDRAFRDQRAMPRDLLDSVRAWQRTDRCYELVQRLARGQPLGSTADRDLAHSIRRDLALMHATGTVPSAMMAYRGVRDVRRTLGVATLGMAVGKRFRQRGFLATSVLRSVAVAEFTAPNGALLEIEIPAGTPAIWVAGIGATTLRRQGELLLGSGHWIEITRSRVDHGLGVLSAEVLR